MKLPKRSLIALVLAVLVLGAGATVVAAEVTAPSVTADSDLDEGVTIANFNADAEENSTLEIATDTADDIEVADVEIELADEDRNLTAYTADLDADEYELVEEDNADGEDIHAWTIDHDEFEEVPMAIDEQVDMDVTVTIEDADGATADTEFTFTLENDDERTVIYVDEVAEDDGDVGPSVDTETHEASWFAANILGEDDQTIHQIEEEREVNGSATDVEIYFADDAADSFDDSVTEDADTEDILADQTILVDGDLAFTFLDEENSDYVSSDDTYAVYDDSADQMTINLGDEQDSNIAADVHVASESPSVSEEVATADISDAFADDLSFMEIRANYGLAPAIRALI
ncbi:hypothetical protein AArcSl_1647 [Halalkaliarchaeum desulfuricum]|uniref:Uncharacterized protein n=1 Tax=Halalkaliarchaeum desulfuricum TaxID=2055893 RepID=A0A343TJK4_9EURY|nr:hypothetical protein [Halalkaliarchaeum desulfuricum]AUX09276.1 hypothetical protein AArcSl_1647 [Halalkaliarchaeum desulfuricum]